MTEQDINDILERYQVNSLQLSKAYPDGGTDPLWPRMQRAALNQLDAGDATLSRYAIWANTVRNNIVAALDAQDDNETEQARFHLIRAANSLSAFSELQKLFDNRADNPAASKQTD